MFLFFESYLSLLLYIVFYINQKRRLLPCYCQIGIEVHVTYEACFTAEVEGGCGSSGECGCPACH
jgi:hypothetical protein